MDDLIKLCEQFKSNNSRKAGCAYSQFDSERILNLIKSGHKLQVQIYDLAKWSGVSGATISRIARQNGYDWKAIQLINFHKTIEKKRKVKTITELMQEDTDENRFFSIHVMGSNPQSRFFNYE